MITYVLIAACVLFTIQGFNSVDFFNRFTLDPYIIKRKKQQYRLATHAFLHGSWVHLFVNMFVLWQFGVAVEKSFGALFGSLGIPYFIVLYGGGILVSALPSLKKQADNPYYRSVGASGAVSAVLFSYILLYPTNMLYLFGILPLPAFLLGALYLWYESRQDRLGKNDGIAHDAHFWGAVFGLAITVAFKPTLFITFIDQLTNLI